MRACVSWEAFCRDAEGDDERDFRKPDKQSCRAPYAALESAGSDVSEALLCTRELAAVIFYLEARFRGPGIQGAEGGFHFGGVTWCLGNPVTDDPDGRAALLQWVLRRPHGGHAGEGWRWARCDTALEREARATPPPASRPRFSLFRSGAAVPRRGGARNNRAVWICPIGGNGLDERPRVSGSRACDGRAERAGRATGRYAGRVARDDVLSLGLRDFLYNEVEQSASAYSRNADSLWLMAHRLLQIRHINWKFMVDIYSPWGMLGMLFAARI